MARSEESDRMLFSDEELSLAQELKRHGLAWSPRPGHYALDQSNLIECGSPFGGRVFFILDLKHFLRRSHTVEQLIARMCWLPDWEQAQQVLQDYGVNRRAIADRLRSTDAIEKGTVLLELYRLIEEQLQG